jgi:Leucine-rich repeat (LRR) protein
MLFYRRRKTNVLPVELALCMGVGMTILPTLARVSTDSGSRRGDRIMKLQGDWKWLIFAGIFCSLCCANTFAQTVSITDPALESSVREALDIASGDITQANMSRLTLLKATHRSITSLSGLEHAVNLTDLQLDANPLTDLAALSELINLRNLWLRNCRLVELGAFSELTQLESLGLGGNAIEDLGPLAGLTNLTGLSLGSNQISDVGPLASLTSLNHLDLDENQISDVAPLAALTNLHTLNLWENQIEEITPFITPSALRNLDLQRNPLSQQALCVDILLMHDAGIGARYDGVCQQGPSGLLNLREYWPFAVGNEWIGQAIADGGIAIRFTDMFVVNGFEVWEFNTVHGSFGGNLPPVISYRVFVDDYLYETITRGDVEQLPTITGDMHGVYPAVVEIGAAMELNLWNFLAPVMVIPYRGSLVSMLGRTGNLVGDLPFGDDPDVVSFRYPDLRARSAAILARDFGPMDDLIGGPITSATVSGGGEGEGEGDAQIVPTPPALLNTNGASDLGNDTSPQVTTDGAATGWPCGIQLRLRTASATL